MINPDVSSNEQNIDENWTFTVLGSTIAVVKFRKTKLTSVSLYDWTLWGENVQPRGFFFF